MAIDLDALRAKHEELSGNKTRWWKRRFPF